MPIAFYRAQYIRRMQSGPILYQWNYTRSSVGAYNNDRRNRGGPNVAVIWRMKNFRMVIDFLAPFVGSPKQDRKRDQEIQWEKNNLRAYEKFCRKAGEFFLS